MRQYFSFECDCPGCRQQMEIELNATRAGQARFLARSLGWLSRSGGIEWFCPAHSAMAFDFDGDATRIHEDWCPSLTRHGACACRVSPVRPLLTGVAVRHIETVKLAEGLL